MLTLIFIILMCGVFGKMIGLAVRASWGILKIVCSVIILPVVLIAMAVSGLVMFAIPILIVAGIVLIVKGLTVA